MDQEQVEIVLNKLLPNILPEHVTDIAFDVRHTAPNEFTLYALFSIPDNYLDNLDEINRAAFIHSIKLKLKNKISGYANINVVFDKDNTRMIRQSDFKK
jgi:hypothetical protein